MKYLTTFSVCTENATDSDAAFRFVSTVAVELQSKAGFEAINVSHYNTEDQDGRAPGEEFFDEYTLLKVVQALRIAGIPDQQAEDAINQMQNLGILFRERA